MFKKSDVGKTIKIIDTHRAAWISIGKEYKIEGYINGSTISINGKSWIATEDCYVFTNDKQDLQIGDRIVILKNIESIKINTEKEIIGFLDDDKGKIIVEGLLPGGWINNEHVHKIKDLHEWRVKTLLEIVREKGFVNFILADKKLISSNIFGKSLVEIKARQIGLGVYYRYPDKITEFEIYDELLTQISNIPENLCIAIKSEKEISKIIPNDGTFFANLKPYLGKNLVDIIPEFDNEYLITMLPEFARGKSFKVNSYIVLHQEFLEVIPISKLKNKQDEEKPINLLSGPF